MYNFSTINIHKSDIIEFPCILPTNLVYFLMYVLLLTTHIFFSTRSLNLPLSVEKKPFTPSSFHFKLNSQERLDFTQQPFNSISDIIKGSQRYCLMTFELSVVGCLSITEWQDTRSLDFSFTVVPGTQETSKTSY